MARAEIDPPRESEKSIPNMSFLPGAAGATPVIRGYLDKTTAFFLGFVGWDRADALETRQGPKSIRRAILRSRFRMRGILLGEAGATP